MTEQHAEPSAGSASRYWLVGVPYAYAASIAINEGSLRQLAGKLSRMCWRSC